MAVSPAEKRFLQGWEEQRAKGKIAFVSVYTFGYTLVFFMLGVAVGLFSGMRLVSYTIIFVLLGSAIAAAFFTSTLMWKRNQQKFSSIIQREIAAGTS